MKKHNYVKVFKYLKFIAIKKYIFNKDSSHFYIRNTSQM